MSTQFDTSNVDLDRTDELPVLDVGAYEASLAANDLSPPRTCTWAVEGSRDIDEPDDESEDVVPSSDATKPSAQAKALTTNVAQILGRIAELEAEIVATHETNAKLQKDCEALRTERAQNELRIEALQADNARFREDRAQSDEITKRLEQQLCARAESIAALERSIAAEKDIGAHLSQQLAAKLMDCEKALSTIELRNRTIEDLIRDCANLNQRLQQEVDAGADLTARLAAAEQSLQKSRALLIEHDDAIRSKDAQLAEAQAQILSVTEERDTLRSVSSQLDERAAEFAKQDAELAQLRREVAAARAEVQSQTKLLNEKNEELGSLRSELNEHKTTIAGFEHAIRVRSEKMDDLVAQLRAVRDERAMMGVQLENARSRAKNLTDQIFSRDNEIAALQANLAVHTEALATIRRDVGRIGNPTEAEFDEVEHMLEPIEQEGPTLYLTGEVLTVGRTSDNDISVPSKLISRCHARLLVGPTGVVIEDANSTNGCYVNGERVRQHLLHDGDVLELGDMRYRLRTRAVRDVRIHESKLPQLSSASPGTDVRIAN